MAASAPRCKIIVIGDGGVGKTSLLSVYVTGKCPTEHIPTIFENYTATVDIGEHQLNIDVWDTAGQEEFDEIRNLSYSDTNIFLMCYAVNNPKSLEHVHTKWFKEVLPNLSRPAYIILVATKVDLRDDPAAHSRGRIISREEGEMAARNVGGVSLMECSSLTQPTTVKAVFDEAIRTFLIPPNPPPVPLLLGAKGKKGKKDKCVLL